MTNVVGVPELVEQRPLVAQRARPQPVSQAEPRAPRAADRLG